MKGLIRFFAKEHLLVNLITLFVVIVGIYSTFAIRKDIWPVVNFNLTVVSAFMGGASPEQVEKLLINPIESSLREVEGIKKVFSTATDSTAVIVVEIDADARPSRETNQDIQQAIDQIDDLPEDVEEPTVKFVDSRTNAVITVTVGADGLGEMELRNYGKQIADELSLLPLVSSVNKEGIRKREYVVEAKSETLAQHRISLSQLIGSIASRNVSVPGGEVQSGSGTESLVRTEAEYTDPQSILKTVIRANFQGYGTKIGDVARSYEALEKPKRLYHANGKTSINLSVAKKANADALKVVASVKKKIEELRKTLPPEIQLGFSEDFSVFLKTRLNTLSSNMLVGLALVLVLLTFFLPFRIALVVAAGIPVALLATIILAHNLGLSLNLLSLIGLIIVMGMLVDDAIVVCENIWRHVEDGVPIGEAVVRGANEVIAPVAASILTTMSAFAPLLFISGIMGSFIFEIPLMVLLALVFSYLEVFIIMPSHVAGWVGPSVKRKREKGKALTVERKWFKKVLGVYEKYIQWALKRRYISLGIVISLFIGTIIFTVKAGRFILFPPGGVEMFIIRAEAPTGTALLKTEKLIKPIEDLVATLPPEELQDFKTEVGRIQGRQNDVQARRGSHVAMIKVSLTPQHTRKRQAKVIIEDLRKQLGEPPGLKKVSFDVAKQGPPQGRAISIDIMGPSFQQLEQIAEEVREVVANLDGAVDATSSFSEGKEEWQIVPRYKDSASVGVSARDIATTVRAAFEGVVASTIRDLDEEINLRVKLVKEEGNIEKQLQSLKVSNRAGNLTPLGVISDFRLVPTLSAVTHFKYKRFVNVSADVNMKKTTPRRALEQIRGKVEEIVGKYPGYELGFSGENEDTKESMTGLARAFIVAAFGIFALLIVTFRKILQPALVLATIPLGFMGVVYGLTLNGRPFSFMAMLGTVALAGVIVNNAIVFIDFVNKSRNEGKDRFESITEAAKTRFRPIFLTTVTTVAGLLPTAYGGVVYKYTGIGGNDPFIVPIALALSFGMAFGAVLTVMFFPAFIAILDDIYALIGKLRGKKEAEA